MRRDELTTGEVAKLCQVAPRTVGKWCDSGKLKHYRIPTPDSRKKGDRRVTVNGLLDFLKEYQMRIPPQLEATVTRQEQRIIVLYRCPVTIQEAFAEAGYQVAVVNSLMELGLSVAATPIHGAVIDSSDGVRVAKEFALHAQRKADDMAVTPDHRRKVPVVILGHGSEQDTVLPVVHWPCSPQEVIRALKVGEGK